MRKEVTKKLDMIIDLYTACPEIFDNNVWKCYEGCKKQIIKMQERGLVSYEPKDYNECIKYISNKIKL